MRILHINPSMAGGGVEAMICGITNELVKSHDVTLCIIFEPNEKDIFIPKLDKRIKIITTHKIGSGVNLKVLWRIYRIIRAGNYDIVHIHSSFYYYILPVLFLRKQKFVYTIHTDARMENRNKDKFFVGLKKLLFRKRRMNAVTISKESQRSFEELYGAPNTLIYNGVTRPKIKPFDIEVYRITSNTRVLFHPGRISLAKNQEMLCRVVSRLIEEGYDIALIIAGNNQDENIYSRIEPYFGERIHYIGMCSNVTDILAQADGFCLSSIWEGMPVTLLEALSVGCVPICTPVGGIPEIIINNENGFLSATSNEADYYEAIKQYCLSSENTLKHIRNNSLESFKGFDIKETSQKYENLYFSLVDGKNS